MALLIKNLFKTIVLNLLNVFFSVLVVLNAKFQHQMVYAESRCVTVTEMSINSAIPQLESETPSKSFTQSFFSRHNVNYLENHSLQLFS